LLAESKKSKRKLGDADEVAKVFAAGVEAQKNKEQKTEDKRQVKPVVTENLHWINKLQNCWTITA